MNDKLKNEINLLPDHPGCYLMHDSNNVVIYVGKAKNLKNRVSQYFLQPHTGKTAAMVSHVEYFETILTDSEKEAFILERNLIDKYMPRYNIMLKDNKRYPYIAVHKVKDPYVSIARKVNDKKCVYYGPFPISTYAFNLIDMINDIFPLRKCNTVGKSPCIYYQLGKCLGNCINKISKKDNDEIIKKVCDFLDGNDANVISELKSKIAISSENLEFEKAKEYKNYLDSVLSLKDKQKVENVSKKSIDVISYYSQNDIVSLEFTFIRNGCLLGTKNFVYDVISDFDDFITEIILQYYSNNVVPSMIIVGNNNIKANLEIAMGANVSSPTRGKYKELIVLGQQNAKKELEEHITSLLYLERDDDLIERLGNKLEIKTPYRIELFDNSHLQGSDAVGAMVCFVNGKPCKKMYRKFNIESLNKRDDLSSMKEVIKRRYSRLKEENLELPDLILIDGGYEQLLAAKDEIEKLELNINLASLAKNDKHRTSKLVKINGDDIDLSDDKELLFLLTRMQDEVHRFAISTHINKRSKSMFKSIFDDIDGLGPKRIENLNKTYKTIDELKRASFDDLVQILPKEVVWKLQDKLKNI